MALIPCPNCGEQISDKSVKCVHCGAVLKEEEPKLVIVCKECGAELEEGAEVCPKCGCPVEEEPEEAPQKVEVTSFKPKIDKKKKNIILAVIAVAVLAVIIGFAAKSGSSKKKAKEYKANLSSITKTMLSGAGDAESAGNLIKKVWYNAIYKEYDSETNEYTRNGVSYVDFNTALGNLFADTDFSTKITAIKVNQNTVKASMKNMQNPPEEYKDAYSSLKEFYDAYNDFVNMVTDPSGSLQTYSSNFNDADNEVMKCYNAMEIYLE